MASGSKRWGNRGVEKTTWRVGLRDGVTGEWRRLHGEWV